MGDVRVGDVCIVERRAAGGAVVHRYEAVVTRITPQRAYLSAGAWFALRDPRREIRPRNLDYTTVVVAVRRAEDT